MKISNSIIIGTSVILGFVLHAFLSRYEIVSNGSDSAPIVFRLNKMTGKTEGFILSDYQDADFRELDLFPIKTSTDEQPMSEK